MRKILQGFVICAVTIAVALGVAAPASAAPATTSTTVTASAPPIPMITVCNSGRSQAWGYSKRRAGSPRRALSVNRCRTMQHYACANPRRDRVTRINGYLTAPGKCRKGNYRRMTTYVLRVWNGGYRSAGFQTEGMDSIESLTYLHAPVPDVDVDHDYATDITLV